MSDTQQYTLRQRIFHASVSWFDNYIGDSQKPSTDEKVRFWRIVPFVLLHLGCLAVIWTGVSWWAASFAAILYFVRMFAVTGIYHRYFSHRTYKLNRFWQFMFALLGSTATQRGALWWAAHHRHHHRHSDEPADIHSPVQRGFWYSHMLWFICESNFRTKTELVPDLVKFPELVWLDRFDIVIPFMLGAGSFFLGMWMQSAGFNTTASQMLVWYLISTVLLAHGTFTINSLSHVFGSRRFETTDTSRNNFLLALVTLGEGWHNNHHHYQSSTRQGFRWYEVDISYYILWSLSLVGIVRDMKPVPSAVMEEARDRRRGAPLPEFVTAKAIPIPVRA